MKKFKSLVIVGHGSMLEGFQRAMEKVARDIRREGRFSRVKCAYLEITKPSIEDAVGKLAAAGAAEIKILPYFLLKGRHTQQHIPAIVAGLKKKHKKTRIVLCPYLGYHRAIVQAVRERAGR